MPYLVKYILSASLSSIQRNASTSCAVTSMTAYGCHELGQMMGGRGPGRWSHVSAVHACGNVMGASQGTVHHVLGEREQREGCAAGL